MRNETPIHARLRTTRTLTFVITALLALATLSTSEVIAAGNGATGGAGTGDQLRTQDQLRTHDPLLTQDQLQVRDQDRITLMDGTGAGAQTQTQERARVASAVNDIQAQAQERLRLLNVNGTPLQNGTQMAAQYGYGYAYGNGSAAGNNASGVTLQYQSRAQVSVQAFKDLMNLTGNCTGAGPCGLADEIRNSSWLAFQLEQRIHERNAFTKLFAGGDAQAVQELEQVTAQNQERIRLMNQSLATCNCTPELRAGLEMQLTQLEMEQARLQTIAQQQYQSKGLFGWLWK